MVGEYAQQPITPGSTYVLCQADAMEADAEAVSAFDGEGQERSGCVDEDGR